MNTACCRFPIGFLSALLASLTLSWAAPDVTFSADVAKRQFRFVVRNSEDRPAFLRTHSGNDWFYTIEIWDMHGRGYRMKTRAQHEADEAGAFLGDWGDIVIAPGEKREFTVAWDRLAADREIMQAVQKLLSDKNHYRSHVEARLIVIYRNSKEGSEQVGVANRLTACHSSCWSLRSLAR
jgi:hypothetical protein